MIKIDFHPSARMLRQFSWIALFAFPLLALLLHHRWGLPWPWFWVLTAFGASVFTAGVVLGNRAYPRAVFIALSVVSVPIGMVLSWILVRLIYWGVFTLIAGLFRLFGRDAMHRKLDPAQQSYWIDRGPVRPPASYFKLY
jgi:hypothetical protein